MILIRAVIVINITLSPQKECFLVSVDDQITKGIEGH